MEQTGYIATGLVSLIVGILLQRFKDRPKLLYWVPGSFLFQLKTPSVAIRTDSLTIQNVGRQPATDLEIIHKSKPDHFQFSTHVNFSEGTTPSGEHVIKITSLGAHEFVNIQLMSHLTHPVLLNVRSADGPAQLIQVHLQRVVPRFARWLAVALCLIGLGFVLYWLASAIVFISQGVGIPK
jgi:hypothetical protein